MALNTISLSRTIVFHWPCAWSQKTKLTHHFWLMCLQQVRKVSGHAYACSSYQYCLFLRVLIEQWYYLILILFLCCFCVREGAFFELKWYSRARDSYQDFLQRGLLLTRKLLNQWFLLVKLKSSLRKFYGRHYDLVDRYGISVSQMTTDMFHLS